MSSILLHLPDNLAEQAAAQAKEMGVSLDQYVAAALAARVGAQSEMARVFQARAERAVRGRAREILARAGRDGPPLPGDELDLSATP